MARPERRITGSAVLFCATPVEMNMLRAFLMQRIRFCLVALVLIVVTAGGLQQPAIDASPQKAKDQPVTVEEVHFRHGSDLLAGTLFLPPKVGPHPAVVLVLGSGAQDRTYGGTGTTLGKHFACHGSACLSWDKPGVGKSTGDYNRQTFHDRAEEALAAVRFLRARTDIQVDRIGLWGHSQGGMLAPLIASMSKEVAFLIEVSGWQGPAWQQDAVRVEAELRADGFAEADVSTAITFAKRRMDWIRGSGSFEELDRAQDLVEGLPWFSYVHRCDRATFYGARRCVNDDISPFWEKVRCPVLVIYGDKDTSSGPPDRLMAIIRSGLAKAGNRDVTEKIFADADHSLCRTRTGGRKEAAERARSRKKGNDPDFVPDYLDTMTNWLAQRFGAGLLERAPSHP